MMLYVQSLLHYEMCWGNYHPLGKWAYYRTRAQLILLTQLDLLNY
jgi:hypothetical protein